MQKKQYWNVKTLVFMALLIAMHLVLTRVLVIDLGAYRISVGSVCTILAGLWLGPVAGGVCGLCADIIGCFMKGYAVNPFITVAAILWGVLPALAKPLFANRKKTGKTVGICVSIVVTAVLSSLVLTTAGLVISTIPTNCLAILFLILFAFKGGWFPISGITKGGCVGLEKIFDIFRHMQLPLIIMILYRTASNHLLMRSTAIQVNEGEYIGTAVSKGMTERRVRLCHMLKNRKKCF